MSSPAQQAAALKAKIDGAQQKVEKAKANGYCDLDGTGKVPVARIPVGGGGGEAFPIGSVFLAVVDTNPGTLLGYGTWSAIAAGKVLVGLASGDPDFDTVEETGGAKAHQHDSLSAGTPSGSVSGIAATGGVGLGATASPGSAYAAQTHTHPAPSFSGDALGSHQHAAASNLPPYFVVYAWKRTA